MMGRKSALTPSLISIRKHRGLHWSLSAQTSGAPGRSPGSMVFPSKALSFRAIRYRDSICASAQRKDSLHIAVCRARGSKQVTECLAEPRDLLAHIFHSMAMTALYQRSTKSTQL